MYAGFFLSGSPSCIYSIYPSILLKRKKVLIFICDCGRRRLACLLVLFHSRMASGTHTSTKTYIHIYRDACYHSRAFYSFLGDFFPLCFSMETGMRSGTQFSYVCASHTIHQTHPKSHRVLHGGSKNHAIELIFERMIIMRENVADRKKGFFWVMNFICV